MSNDDIATLLHEFTDRTEQQPDRPPTQLPADDAPDTGPPGDSHSSAVRLDRSFASEYLDELIIAILFRCDEANGMDIIREFTHLFGVQFSPGTVYPHLHSLEEEGVLACRERVQTKEYHIDDDEAGREYIRSVMSQMTCLRNFLGTIPQDSEGR